MCIRDSLICEPGGKAGEVGKANLIGYDDHEIVAAYSMAAEFLGFRLLYLEAGSGSQQPVNPELIKTARGSCELPIIVGGGIWDAKSARAAAESGADWIITGNITEEYDDASELQAVLTELIDGLGR